MSDLISRQIVLDILQEEKSFRCGYDADIAILSIEKKIKEQPLAYDIEKVVAELESAENYYYDDTLDAECNLVMFKSIRQDVAIDIVRKGGVK